MVNSLTRRPYFRRVTYAALAVLIAAAAFVIWSWPLTSQLEAIGQLPEVERRALYERTLGTLTSTCSADTRPSGLDSFCREQAEFIQHFPECDSTCRSLVQQYDRAPTR